MIPRFVPQDMAMMNLNISLKVTRLVRMTMREVHGRVKIESDLSDSFDCNTGLSQGDSFYCLLFNVVHEKVARDSGLQKTETIASQNHKIASVIGIRK